MRAKVVYYGCLLAFTDLDATLSTMAACKITGANDTNSGTTKFSGSAPAQVIAGAIFGTWTIQCKSVTLTLDCTAQSVPLCQVAEGGTYVLVEGPASAFDFGAVGLAPNVGIFVSQGTKVEAADLIWGSSTVAGSEGIRVESGGQMNYVVLPTITGAAGDTDIGGESTAYVDLPFFNAANGAAITEKAP